MIATSGKHSYKMCVKSTTRREKLTTKNEDGNVTNANCNSLYMLVTMIYISISDNKRRSNWVLIQGAIFTVSIVISGLLSLPSCYLWNEMGKKA